MSTLWNPADRAALISRVNKLNASSVSRWGKMTIAEVTTHMVEGFKIALNEKAVEVIPGKRPSGFVLWLIIFSPLPWPKGKLITAKEYLADSSEIQQLDAYKKSLIACLQRFSQTPESMQFGKHAFFNELTPEQWGALMYRHTDHHLKQFGC